LKNFYFLDKDWININGVFFYGGTLWTDMNNEDPRTMREMAYCMNDYRGVDNSSKMVQYRVPVFDENNKESFIFKEKTAQFTPEDTVIDHKEFLKGLDLALGLYPNRLYDWYDKSCM